MRIEGSHVFKNEIHNIFYRDEQIIALRILYFGTLFIICIVDKYVKIYKVTSFVIII